MSFPTSTVTNLPSVRCVCGKIFTTRYFADSKDPITLLNMGAAFPNQQLTVMITAEARKEFKEAPETFYKDKNICVTGKVIIYKDKPEIIINHADQLMEAMDGK